MIAAQIDQARKDLLDLSLRNPLLNYRLLRTRGLRLLVANASEVFRWLVLEEKKLEFVPAVPQVVADGATIEPEQSLLQAAGGYLEGGDEVSQRRTMRVQPGHSADDLRKRLVATYRLARTALEEQGVNMLYVVLGMLNWFESECSEERRAAPLVLVPITLERVGRGMSFRAQFSGEEVGVNLSLQKKLQVEFGMELPEAPSFESTEELDSYFHQVRHAVASEARWSVDAGGAAVGFFSFAKFLMFHDLDPHACASEEAGPGSALLRALLGEGFSAESDDAVDESDLDKVLDPQDIFHVYDADSTQTSAILHARRAPCLVIQGPPGTGKSQTITNLIAEAVCRGRTVLFVAEKRAALEVVQRRLANAGLADICLELHSNKTDKRQVLAELKRTLDLMPPRVPPLRESIAELVANRDRLNAYCAAMNTPVGTSSTTPYVAIGWLVRLAKRVNTATLPIAVRELCIEGWTLEDFRRRARLLRDIEKLLSEIGDPLANPFWGSKRHDYVPGDSHRVTEAASAALDALDHLVERCGQLSVALDGRAIQDQGSLEKALAIAEVLASQPRLEGIALRHDAWDDQGERILELLFMIEWLCEARARRARELRPEAWRCDGPALSRIQKVLAGIGQKWYRHLFPSYRKAVRELAALLVGECPTSPTEQLALVNDLVRAQLIAERLREDGRLLEVLFGSRLLEEAPGLRELAEVTKWLARVHNRITAGELPGDVLEFLERGCDVALVARLKAEVRAALDRYAEAMDQAIRTALCPDGKTDGVDLWQQPFAVQKKTLASWRANPGALRDLVHYINYMASLKAEGLEEWVEFIPTWRLKAASLPDVLAYAWYTSIVKQAFHEREALSGFRGTAHTEVLEAFRDLDRELIKFNRSRVAWAHWERVQRVRTGAASGQVGVLMQEINKKRRHMPLRKLLERAGNAVQQIKPVFMMSPLSVAALIPKGSVAFDLVIFDEASQVRPVDAFGAILRGRKVIIIGDTMQLPPTTFFDSISEVECEDEDCAFDSPADTESILHLFRSKGAPERMLRWHYRSLHESLISVSNREFYDNRLVVFPSAGRSGDGLGVFLRYNPDTVYIPGAGRAHNPKEAEEVARAVMKHARDFPDLTLGVVAFSLSQARLIEDFVERERRLDDSCEGFFRDHPEEPFFVKNLENVQGDERDVIFISVGYGKQLGGKMSMNFGPLNHAGGERRLNVLITRARYRCEIFCNFRASDVLLERSSSRGVQVLKQYLQYAETREELGLAQISGREPDSPFEEEVAERIRAAGYGVHHQVGSEGYFIDIGVVDPSHPGRYLVGVECDGASYHSAKWARDRDRLRQEVLEARGWRIVRVWSTDWFSNPERETRRLLEEIERAKHQGFHAVGWDSHGNSFGDQAAIQPREARGRPLQEHREADVIRRTEGCALASQDDPRAPPYRQADLSPIVAQLRNVAENLHQVSPEVMAEWVRLVVETEGPVHARIITKRIREGAGLRRTGSRIQRAVDSAICLACALGLVQTRGDFVWKQYAPEASPRDRSNLPADERSAHFIAPEEIAGAILESVRRSLGLERADLVREVVLLLGFNRTSAETEAVIGRVIDDMCSTGRLRQKGAYLDLP